MLQFTIERCRDASMWSVGGWSGHGRAFSCRRSPCQGSTASGMRKRRLPEALLSRSFLIDVHLHKQR